MSESINSGVQEEVQEETGFTKWFTYTALTVCLIVSSIAFYASYSYSSEANEANAQVKKVNASTGAKIDALLNKRTENRKIWTEAQNRIDASFTKQSQLNSDTARIEEELKKLNISLIN